MAVRIPIYQQQTATPNARVNGGNPIAVGGPDLGGALMDLAGGIAGVARAREAKRKELEDSTATAWAARTLPGIQLEAAKKFREAQANAGEGGAGVEAEMSAWMDQQIAAAQEAAPNETARNYIGQRLMDFRGTLTLRAFEYEVAELEKYNFNSYTEGAASASRLAATDPGSGEVRAAEYVAAVRADRALSEDSKRRLITDGVESISYGEVLGEIERDPYAAERALRVRFGFDENATPQQLSLQRDSAVEMLGQIEADAGVQVPADRQQEAVANLMTGGYVRFENGEFKTGKGSGMGGRSAGWAYDALSVPKAAELLSRVQSEIAQRENEAKQANQAGKVLFDQEVRNIEAALNAGEPQRIPDTAQFLRYYTPEQTQVIQRGLQVKQSMAADLQRMAGMTNAELLAVAADTPKGTGDRQFRDEAYQITLARAKGIMQQRDADPGQYVVDTSRPVQLAYEENLRESQRVAELGASATEQDIQASIAAQSNYIAISRMEQQRLGIENPRLPKAFVSQVVKDFTAGMGTDAPDPPARRLEALVSSMVDQPEAVAQVLNEVGPLGQLAADGVDGLTIKRVRSVMQLEESKRAMLLPQTVSMKDVREAVASAFAPLDATFAAGNDKESPVRYREAAIALALDRIASGEAGGDVNRAASMAYDDLVGRTNAIVDTYRVDTRLYDPKLVQAGLMAYLQGPLRDDMMPEVDVGFTEEESVARKARTVMLRHKWVNDLTGRGVFLMHNNGYVMGRDGKPLLIPFDRAMEIGLERPAPPPAAVTGPGTVGRVR